MGKSSGSAPEAPDPKLLVGLQSAADRRAFNYQNDANRYTSIGPDQTVSWNKTPTFDQAGYDAALSDWNKTNQQGTYIPATSGGSGIWGDEGYSTPATPGYWSGATSNGQAQPNKADYTSYNWAQTTQLSPQQQQLHDLAQSSAVGQAGLLDALTGRLKEQYSKPIDYSGLPQIQSTIANNGDTQKYTDYLGGLNPQQYNQQAQDAAYGSATRYLDPQIALQQKALEARLSEQGFVPGTPGYQQAMQQFQQTSAQSYADARDRAITTGAQVGSQQFQNALQGGSAALGGAKDVFGNNTTAASFNNTSLSQALSQLLQQRGQPLNELNAIRSGTQLNAGATGTPNSQTPTAPNMAAPDVQGAYQQQYQSLMDKYNAGVQTDNANTGATVGVLSALALAFSDERLKSNIAHTGEFTEAGTPVYTYDIFGHREKGVMAQDLLEGGNSDAVALDPSGYLKVDYSKVR